MHFQIKGIKIATLQVAAPGQIPSAQITLVISADAIQSLFQPRKLLYASCFGDFNCALNAPLVESLRA